MEFPSGSEDSTGLAGNSIPLARLVREVRGARHAGCGAKRSAGSPCDDEGPTARFSGVDSRIESCWSASKTRN